MRRSSEKHVIIPRHSIFLHRWKVTAASPCFCLYELIIASPDPDFQPCNYRRCQRWMTAILLCFSFSSSASLVSVVHISVANKRKPACTVLFCVGHIFFDTSGADLRQRTCIPSDCTDFFFSISHFLMQDSRLAFLSLFSRVSLQSSTHFTSLRIPSLLLQRLVMNASKKRSCSHFVHMRSDNMK